MTQAQGGEIAEVQLLQLYLDVNQDIDTQFQVWISITFAVLVASFVAGPRLGRLARTAIALLYVSATVILYLRYTRAASYIPYTIELFRRYQVAEPQTVGVLAYELRRSLFTVGSAVTALAVLVPRLGHRAGPPGDAEPPAGEEVTGGGSAINP